MESEKQAPETRPPAATPPETAPPDPAPDGAGPQNSKERLYEKLPFTYRQVDVFVKVLIAMIAVVVVVGIAVSGR